MPTHHRRFSQFITSSNSQRPEPSINLAVLMVLIFLPILAMNCSAQSCVSPPADLVSWWAAEANSNDEIGGNHGTLLNGATYSTAEVGQGFFLTSGGHVRVPDSPAFHFTSAMTVEAWIYPTTHGGYHTIVGKWDVALLGGMSYALSVRPDGLPYFGVCADGNSQVTGTAIASSSLPLNQWTYLAGTYDGTTVRIYVDGVLQGQASFTQGIFPGTHDLAIGGIVGGAGTGQVNYPFEGGIDEVALYGRTLSDAEIAAIFQAGTAGKCKVPTAPAITSDPTNLTVNAGESATFRVSASGHPLAFQWRLNNTALPGATNSILMLTNVQPSQAGNYSATVSNQLGLATSADAALTVIVPTCVAAPSNLVSWWQGDSDAHDVMGTNSGTLRGGVSFAAGKVGMAFSFNGTNGHVRITNSVGLRFTNAMTVEAWINPIRTVSEQGIVSKWDAVLGPNQRSFAFSMAGDGRVYLLLSPGGTDTSAIKVFSTNSIPAQVWTHVAGTYDGAAIKIYVNGELQNQGAYSLGIFPGTNDLAIGGVVGGAAQGQVLAPFPGRIDEAAIYDRALSGSEIQSIFGAENAGKCAVLPTIVAQPQNQRCDVGTNVTFAVVTRGTSPLSYQWRVDGSDLAGATNALLTLSNVQPSSAGSYSVKITNGVGVAISSNAVLKVNVVFAYGNGQPLTNAQASLSSPATIQLQNIYVNGYTFYTLDGSEPSFASTEYNGPFILTHNAVLRAIGYRIDFFESGELDPVNIAIVPVYSLSTTTPGGGIIHLSPIGGSYLSNSVVNLTAIPASNWFFLQWSGDASGTNPATSITMNRNKSVSAIFGTTLTATAAGNGSIMLNPPGGIYPYGTVVWLAGIPLPGSYFGLWGNAASGNVNPLRFLVTNANPTISSIFGSVGAGQAALTVVPLGNGQISVSPRANIYNVGQGISITATPDSGQTFLGWSGDAAGLQNPLALTMNQSKTIYANFSRKPSLSVRTGFEGLKPEGFQMTLTGEYGAGYEIDGSTNLVNWIPLGFLTNSYGSSQFLDSSATNLNRRFYRAVLVP
jgi:hypothetical protein